MSAKQGTPPKVDTEWFKVRLMRKRMSQRYLAKLMELDPSALSLMINGKRAVTVQEAAKLAHFLNHPYLEVSRRLGASIPDKEMSN